MNFVRVALAALLLTLLINAHAAKDPVSWSLSPATGFQSTKVGSVSTVQYTLTNHIPQPVKLVTEIKLSKGTFHIEDGCNDRTLAIGASCSVVIAYAPTVAGIDTAQLIYGYHNNRIPLPVLTATGSANTEVIRGAVVGLPPAFTLSNPEQHPDFSVTYTNTGLVDVIGYAGNIDGLNILSLTPASVATVAVQSNTCGTKDLPITLHPGSSCTIIGQLTPVALGLVTVQGLFTYAGGSQTASPSAGSEVINGSGACIVHGYASLPLPDNTYKYADNVVQFTFENECDTLAAPLGSVSLTSNSTPQATITTTSEYDLCSNKTLAPGSDCTVTASVIPADTGSLQIQAAVPTGTGIISTTTSAVVASNQQTKHHVLFVNQCPFPVWYGIANGNGSECPGVACKTPDPNILNYASGVPPVSAYYLSAQVLGSSPSTIDLAADSYQNGAYWPRTGCVVQGGQLNCTTGTCATLPNSGACVSPPSSLNQPQQPVTKFEATLIAGAGLDGVYDVSVINGMNVPVEVKAFGPTVGVTRQTVYECTAAGAIIQPPIGNPPTLTSPLGACSWKFDPSRTLTTIPNVNNDFYWVTAGSDDNCQSGPRCGMSWSAYPSSTNPGGGDPPNVRRNGDFLAFTTLTNSVGFSSPGQWGSVNLFEKYSMGVQIPGQSPSFNYGTQNLFGSNTYDAYYNLIACVPDHSASTYTPGPPPFGSADSCYQVNLTGDQFRQCCGCVNWDESPYALTLPSTPCGFNNTTPYVATDNPDWKTRSIDLTSSSGSYTIQNAIAWLKYGCPTAYVYQFDDVTSSFTCTHDGSTALKTSYQVTFCPGGVTGLPAGATEGRNSTA